MARAAKTHLHAVSKPQPLIAAASGVHSERELFELVYQRMRTLARGAPDFDDLVQLAAEQVFRSLPSFDGRSQIETWIFGVCYRVLLSQRRWYWRFRQRFSSDSSAIDARTDDATPNAHDSLEAKQRLALLYRALDRMSEKYRVALVLYYLEGIESSEIARIVNANELTVRSRLRDGRKQLLELLAPNASEIFIGANP